MRNEGRILGNHTQTHRRETGTDPGYPRPFLSFGHLSETEMRGEFCACHTTVMQIARVNMRVYRAPGESRYPADESGKSRPFNWDRIDRAAKLVNPAYQSLTDASMWRIRTLNDMPPGPGKPRPSPARIFGNMVQWLMNPKTPADVVICYHDPQADPTFTRQLLRILQRLGIQVQDAP